jgi:hypothetical protein
MLGLPEPDDPLEFTQPVAGRSSLRPAAQFCWFFTFSTTLLWNKLHPGFPLWGINAWMPGMLIGTNRL